MRVLKTTLTPALLSWLQQAGDPGRNLTARQDGEDIEIEPEPLTESEQLEVKALLAADSVEPLSPLPHEDSEAFKEISATVDFDMTTWEPGEGAREALEAKRALKRRQDIAAAKAYWSTLESTLSEPLAKWAARNARLETT